MNNGPGVFTDETTLDLPPGYKTVKLQIASMEWTPGQIPVSEMFEKIKEIIKFINMQQITVTGNEEFLEQFKEWIQK